MAKAIYSIYEFVNIHNEKTYVGFTNNIKTRQRLHFQKASDYQDDCPKFYNAIRKYGKESFQLNILFQTPSKETALLAESYFININNSIKNGYNILSGGQHGGYWKDKKLSQSHKNNISKSLLGNQRRLGKKHTQKDLTKMSKSHNKEYTIITPNGTTITINNLKEFCKNNNLNYRTVVWAKNKNKSHKGYTFS